MKLFGRPFKHILETQTQESNEPILINMELKIYIFKI